jgi:cation diffusion facilitator family transporter
MQNLNTHIKKRNSIVVRTSLIGIIANVLLAAFKAIVGIMSHSIAIVLDAVNNFSDALSSIITIIGTKLASKAPDKNHPLGHGRIEFIAASIISVIVLYAGISALTESLRNLVNHVEADYSWRSLLVITVAVLVKLILGNYVKTIGERVNSKSLIASGADALFDAVLSTSVLVTALLYKLFGISLEAYVGILISFVIIKSGYDLLTETINDLLGKRVDDDLAVGIKELVSSMEGVYGAYDLIVHNYGPNDLLGSVHIEVDDSMTAWEIDRLTRLIQKEVYDQYGVVISAVGVYARNTSDSQALEIRKKLTSILSEYPYIKQFHGIHINTLTHLIAFDIIIEFEQENRNKLYDEIVERVKKEFKGFDVSITLDGDFSE